MPYKVGKKTKTKGWPFNLKMGHGARSPIPIQKKKQKQAFAHDIGVNTRKMRAGYET